ncbi:HD domain-containing protein [Mucilaginibacter hurinus]|nr:HD domain-containing protein [Mucilaginibacter hurinus]
MKMELIENCEKYVRQLFDEKLPASMYFHNIDHTLSVVAATERLLSELTVSDSDKQIVLVAAWLHDTGYCYTYEGHEAISMTLAGDFLRNEQRSDLFISEVNYCIRATRFPPSPVRQTHSIICDADMAHLSSPYYPELTELLRKEWEVHLGQTYTEQDWDKLNLRFLSTHRYFTSAGQSNWESGKMSNLRSLERKVQRSDDDPLYPEDKP